MNKIKNLIYTLKNFFSYLLSSKPIVIYIGGYPTIANVGDVALFEAYQYFLPGCTFVHYRGNRVEKLLYRIFNYKKVFPVLSGGTLINHMSLREASDAKSIFGAFFVFGTGVAQSSYWHGKSGYHIQEDEWREVLKGSPYIGVRGPLSVNQLSEMDTNSEVFGDPVLSLANLRKGEVVLAENEGSWIGLNVGKSLGHVQGGEENLKQVFIELANELIKRGNNLKWFVVCPEDLPVTQEIVAQSGGNICCIYHDYKEYYANLVGVQAFIGTKLHSVCLSLNYSVPSIMIEYRPKCRDFMASLGLEDYSLSASTCTSDSILKKYDQLTKDNQEYIETANANIMRYQQKQKGIVQSFFNGVFS